MMDVSMIDPMGAVIAELKADATLSSLVHGRVRGEEPAPGDARGPVDPEDPDSGYQAFVVITTFEDPPHPRLPIQRALYGLNCYGATFQNARAVWGAVVKAMHLVGARLASNGVGIYVSVIEGGGESDHDPDTNQPVIRGTLRITTTVKAMT